MRDGIYFQIHCDADTSHETFLTLTDHRTLFVSGLCVLWLSLAGRQAAQAPGMSVTPANPTISVGQTQQFTANGAITPTGVSAGGEYTCLRLPNGTVQCVGRNQFGQLANGTIDNSSVLGAVSGLTTATRLAAGDEFACALLADGTARCWGLGESGQRGDGTFTTFSSQGERPVAVSGLTGGVDITGGYGHACALLADGTMRCWGRNVDGELGNPSAQPGSSVPVAVSGITGAAAITAGAFHTCAVLVDGTLRCWGRNGTRAARRRHRDECVHTRAGESASPVSLPSAAAAFTPVRVLTNGTVQCWGENEFGQLGDGTTMPSITPVPVSGITGAVGVSAGWRHTCAVLGNGTVRVLGRERVRAARQRDHDELGHPGAGNRNHRRRRRHCRVVAPQLRAPWRRHGAVLGRRTSGASSVTAPRPAPPRRRR